MELCQNHFRTHLSSYKRGLEKNGFLANIRFQSHGFLQKRKEIDGNAEPTFWILHLEIHKRGNPKGKLFETKC